MSMVLQRNQVDSESLADTSRRAVMVLSSSKVVPVLETKPPETEQTRRTERRARMNTEEHGIVNGHYALPFISILFRVLRYSHWQELEI